MKKILFLALSFVLVSCTNDSKIDYVLMSGKAKNTTADKIVINNDNFNREIHVEADGTFTDTLRLTEPGYYSLIIDKERASVYLKNGFDINLILDVNEFDKTLSFTGKGSVENNYLAAKQRNIIKSTSNPRELYSLDETNFKTIVENIKKANVSLLESLADADPDFFSYEINNLEYDSYVLLNNYEGYHSRFLQLEDFKVSEDFLPDALKNITYNDATAYETSSTYKSMAFDHTMNNLFETIGNDYLLTTPEDLRDIEHLAIPALKDEVIKYLGGFMISPGNPNMTGLYEFFLANTTNERIKTKLNEVFEKWENLTKGNPSPQFTDYENHKGGTLSLAELKGKYVFIDVWATWCGPCKVEIPSLKEVEKQFHGKNIVFVSTSIDVVKDHDKWFQMVNNMNLGGTQLIADNDWNSKFIKDYGIEFIPRFILVDPDGNIVSADAPRPSNPRLVELFNSLGI